MSFDLRQALNALFNKEKYSIPADYSQYGINMFLAKYRSYLPVLEPLMLLTLNNKAHFKYLQKKLPYGWPRKVEPVKIEKDPIQEYIMRTYECSRRDAQDYLKFMSEYDKDELKDYYEGEQ